MGHADADLAAGGVSGRRAVPAGAAAGQLSGSKGSGLGTVGTRIWAAVALTPTSGAIPKRVQPSRRWTLSR